MHEFQHVDEESNDLTHEHNERLQFGISIFIDANGFDTTYRRKVPHVFTDIGIIDIYMI